MNAFDEVAFGGDPGRWPLPTATTPAEHWLRAVAAGGQGRYGSALADLVALVRRNPEGPLASLALSTRASFLRQLGGHEEARAWDGRASACAGLDAGAAADALIGLGADALGVSRFALSDRLLQRAADLVCATTAPRLPIRLAWVRAELAMFTGDGPAAVAYAERAVELADGWTSVRHVVKSQVVTAAALCSAGRIEGARRVADAALTVAEQTGLIPLSWALTCLLADIGSAAHSPEQIGAARDRFADTVRQRGGSWTAR
ncbi:hypothetical protein [Mycolicibacterium sp. 050158]|uniref:hypothetical protein n=1 Tax=Mycolicibacterium sp. 050158 TaxID=3090602 RepID=UPI00299DA9E0|nr:hypothetical protein [Mycolicibacterium sp. 050158]MDX1888386.1 hypothetical protein [Mycolicibacterium sp. 050158]